MNTMANDKDSECCCTVADIESLSGAYSCADKKYVFTPRETAVLAKIREAAMRARDIKKEMMSLGREDARRAQAARELEELRSTRAELERERIAAAEERMRMLGHI
ncbi:MAG: hypothetical protein LLG06_06225 [Desulfobacteraceae bacterium]|nr:hypothetical protein [Desulfobacteraceae bacterium]